MIHRPAGDHENNLSERTAVFAISSSAVTGSRILPSEEVDRAFGMPIGKLRNRAGIESLAYAAEGENELTLGAGAAQEALRAASCGAQQLDWIIATSETHHDYPSLAAQLHSRLLVREDCGALDVGGACLGLLNALAVAQALIGSGHAQRVAMVTAEPNSLTRQGRRRVRRLLRRRGQRFHPSACGRGRRRMLPDRGFSFRLCSAIRRGHSGQ